MWLNGMSNSVILWIFEEVDEEMQQRPKGQFCIREREGLKHKMIRATDCKRLHLYICCNKKSTYERVLVGACQPK